MGMAESYLHFLDKYNVSIEGYEKMYDILRWIGVSWCEDVRKFYYNVEGLMVDIWNEYLKEDIKNNYCKKGTMQWDNQDVGIITIYFDGNNFRLYIELTTHDKLMILKLHRMFPLLCMGDREVEGIDLNCLNYQDIDTISEQIYVFDE